MIYQNTTTDNCPTQSPNFVDTDEKWMENMHAVQSLRLEHKRTVCKNSFGVKKSSIPSKHNFDLTYSNDDYKFLVTTVWKIGASHWRKVFRILHDKGSTIFRKRQPTKSFYENEQNGRFHEKI